MQYLFAISQRRWNDRIALAPQMVTPLEANLRILTSELGFASAKRISLLITFLRVQCGTTASTPINTTFSNVMPATQGIRGCWCSVVIKPSLCHRITFKEIHTGMFDHMCIRNHICLLNCWVVSRHSHWKSLIDLNKRFNKLISSIIYTVQEIRISVLFCRCFKWVFSTCWQYFWFLHLLKAYHVSLVKFKSLGRLFLILIEIMAIYYWCEDSS